MSLADPASKMPPELLEVRADYAGQRIDNFLLAHLKGVPRSYIYRVLRTGEVRVNKGRAKPTYRVQSGDIVRIPPMRRPAEPAPAQPGDQVLDTIRNAILYEDPGLIVLNKPSGVAVHGGSGLSYGVIEALRVLRPGATLELVHRLDRETSGCLMVAKKRSVLKSLHELLRGEGGVDKRYLALIRGPWQGDARTISAPLLKNILRSGERMVSVSEEGKDSVSLFRPMERYADATLMEVRPLTGRTHQIRVHALHIGQPIAGDDKYGDKSFNRAMRERGLKRLFLHARSLAFQLPGSGNVIEVAAPLDPVLANVLKNLNKLP